MSLAPGEDAPDVRRAIDRVIARGWFVLGPEVEAFEAEFAAAAGAAHAVGVGNGTDAIALTLRALGIGPGDEVITAPLSAAYTALAIMMTGARPVFADIDPVRLTIDPERIVAAITSRTLGDGGAIVTNDGTLAERIRRSRNGGQTDRYHHEVAGVNSRLDELQAAVLRARLPRLDAWTDRRRALAARYRAQLAGARLHVPPELDPGHVYHLFVVRTDDRAALQAHLAGHGIETLIHYPVPIPRQPALAASDPAACPAANAACDEVLSLPLSHALGERDVDEVAAAVNAFERTDECVH